MFLGLHFGSFWAPWAAHGDPVATLGRFLGCSIFDRFFADFLGPKWGSQGGLIHCGGIERVRCHGLGKTALLPKNGAPA